MNKKQIEAFAFRMVTSSLNGDYRDVIQTLNDLFKDYPMTDEEKHEIAIMTGDMVSELKNKSSMRFRSAFKQRT